MQFSNNPVRLFLSLLMSAQLAACVVDDSPAPIGSNLQASLGEFYSASSGPVSASVNFNDEGLGQFLMQYTGYLYYCNEPSYDPPAINVHLIFHRAGKTRVFEREMYGLCTTPWNYTQPTLAQLNTHESVVEDAEFWSELRATIFGSEDGPTYMETAFEFDGNWDSNYSQNFPLQF